MDRKKICSGVMVFGAALTSSANADVLVVGPPWVGGYYTDIQSAVDSAQDGDVILVHTADPVAFSIDGKSVAVVEWPGRTCSVVGTITVRNLPANGVVLLHGISATAPSVYPKSPPALRLENNAGQVRVQEGGFIGGSGGPYGVTCGWGDAGEAVDIADSFKVLMQRCTMRGGTGGGDEVNGCHGGLGGHGVLTSGSALALYDCEVTGGLGGSSDGYYGGNTAGNGGDGVRAMSWGVFLSGGFARGGKGGSSWAGAHGGDGVFLDASAQARCLDVTLEGGAAGTGAVPGAPGAPTGGGGAFFMLPETSVRLNSTAVSSDRVALEIVGEPGQQVWLFVARRSDQRFVEGWTGIAAFPAKTISKMTPVGTISPTGRLLLDVPILAPLGAADTMWIQALVKPEVGDPVLSAPRAVTTLAAPLPPG